MSYLKPNFIPPKNKFFLKHFDFSHDLYSFLKVTAHISQS